jgi:hypothetical protein
LRKMTFAAYHFSPSDGSLQKRELVGPPGFDEWWKSFRTFKVLLILLGAVTPETLDTYGEKIRSLHQQYGPQFWWVIYQADVRMRSEHMERLRRDLEVKKRAFSTVDPTVASILVSYDVNKPWEGVFKAAAGIEASEFWNVEVREKVSDFRSKSNHRGPSVEMEHSVAAAADSPKRPKLSARKQHSPASQTKSGRACANFNSDTGCNNVGCKNIHKCEECGKVHSVTRCWVRFPDLKPDGKGKGGKGGKGKGSK